MRKEAREQGSQGVRNEARELNIEVVREGASEPGNEEGSQVGRY